MKYKRILWLVPCLVFLTGANTSNVKKGANSTISVSDRDGSSVVLRASQYPLVVSGTNYTIGDTDSYDIVYVTTGASNRTITLPSVRKANGRKIRVVKADTGSGSIIMAVTNGSLIGTVPKVSSQNGMMEFACDANNWFLISLHDEGTFTATLGAVSAGGTTTWSYSRVNSVVTINVFGNSSGANNNFYWQFTKNGSSGAVTITGHPESIRPTVASTWIQTWQVSYNNAGSPGSGLSTAGSELDTGQFNVYRTVAGDGFGSGTQSAILANSFSYTIR